MDGINMDFETLYVGYVGKNVLNFFPSGQWLSGRQLPQAMGWQRGQ